MPYSQGFNLTQGLEIVTSNFEELKNEFYETLYQEVYWQKAMPAGSIDSSINPGATTTSYRVSDWRGVGGFISDFGGDVPTVKFSSDKVAVNLHLGGIGGIYTLEDLRTYQFAYGKPIDTELARLMAMGSDRHIEGVTMYGQSELGIAPYTDLPNVDVSTVPVGASTETEWTDKTADEQIKDVQDAIRDVWLDSKQVHLPDTVELPPEQFSILNDTRIADAVDNSALEWLRTHNLYYQMTGKELTIIPNPHLTGAGVAGVDRMIVKENLPRNFWMPFPIPARLLAPQLQGYAIKLLNEYKFSGMHVRYPGCMVYRDGI